MLARCSLSQPRRTAHQPAKAAKADSPLKVALKAGRPRTQSGIGWAGTAP